MDACAPSVRSECSCRVVSWRLRGHSSHSWPAAPVTTHVLCPLPVWGDPLVVSPLTSGWGRARPGSCDCETHRGRRNCICFLQRPLWQTILQAAVREEPQRLVCTDAGTRLSCLVAERSGREVGPHSVLTIKLELPSAVPQTDRPHRRPGGGGHQVTPACLLLRLKRRSPGHRPPVILERASGTCHKRSC